MLRIIGIMLLTGGSAGLGWSVRNSLKERLHTLYRIRQILLMLQNEITYSRASLPEACRRVGTRLEEPFGSAFAQIYEDMLANSGCSFYTIWKRNMETCLKSSKLSGEDKRILVEFGECAGYVDGQMQGKAVEHYMHSLDLSVKKLEEDMANKSRVIMSLSVMGGLLLSIMLL